MSIERRYALLKHTHLLSDLGGGLVNIGTGAPTIRFRESDATANNAVWDFTADGDDLKWRVVLDDLSAATDWLIVNRTGITVDAIELRANVVRLNGLTWFSDGSAGAPSAAFVSDGADNGFYHVVGTDNIHVSIGGARAIAVNGVSATGAQTATFVAANKPGSGTAAPISWLPVLTSGGTQGYIPIFGA